MSRGRVADKVAIVVGGGQTPGATVGNGRATALLLAREGAKVLVADRDADSAEETAEMVRSEGGTAGSIRVDVTQESEIEAMVADCTQRWGRIDILHNNVGVSEVGGDAPVTEIDAAAFSRVTDINLRGMVLTAKHALPVMRAQGSGCIVNISSVAVQIDFPWITYQTSKAGVVALTEHLAIRNAEFGIRANVILPGLVNTPMAVERHLTDGICRDDIVADRSARTPLVGRPGTAWDVANTALFLACDEAGFITGASITVDGGQCLVRG